MKSQKKKYSRPQKPFDKIRIEEENILKERYGLKNKKEIWKADAAIGRIRNQAKMLITASKDEQGAFIEKFKKKGFQIKSIADVLGLNKEDWMKRRLQTVVHKKGLTNTTKQARQFIAHKHVSIGNQIVNIPSYQVDLDEESLVKLDIVLKTAGKKSKMEEIKESVLEGKGEGVSEEVPVEVEVVPEVEVPAEVEAVPEKLNEPVAPEIEVK